MSIKGFKTKNGKVEMIHTDTKLTEANSPADSQAVGQAIANLKKNVQSAIELQTSIGNMAFSDINNVDTYSQVNAVASDYINNTDYSLDDTTTSEIGEYYATPTSYRKDQPAPYVVLAPSENCVCYAVDESTGALISSESNTGTLSIYNVVPNNIYHYWVARTSTNGLIMKGKFRPTGALRMVYAPSINNARDIGGWACNGGSIRYGLIFRGCELTGEHNVNISETDKETFRDVLGIGFEMDLRSDTETDMDTDDSVGAITTSALGEDVKYSRHSLAMYYNGVNIYGTGWLAYRTVVEEIMDSVLNDIPVYVHCVQGADRTGGVIWLIEGLLGVSMSDMDKDYELTTFSNEGPSAGRVRNDRNYRSMVDNFLYTIDGSSQMQKFVNWCGYAGIPIEKVNSFRKKMINGNPATVAYTFTDYGVDFEEVTGWSIQEGVKRDSSTGEISETGSATYSASDFISVGNNIIVRLESAFASHRPTITAAIYCYDRLFNFLGSTTAYTTGSSKQYIQAQLLKNTEYIIIRCYHTAFSEEEIDSFFASLKLYLSAKKPLIECTGITLDKSVATITDTGSLTLNATISPANTNQPINWSTSDITIAGVSGGLVVPSETTGTVTITATCGEHSASCVVTVVEHSTSWETVSAPLTLGTKISSSDGVTITTDNNYAASDHINVENYTHIRLNNSYSAASSSSSNIAIYCYNSNGERVRHLTTLNYGSASTGDIEIPQNEGIVTVRLRVYVDFGQTATKQAYLDATTLELGR